jgi:hypothetical protein
MHRILFRRGVIGLVLGVGLVGSAIAHAATQSPAHGSRTLATSTSGPDTINELPCPNFDNKTGLPKPGTVCIGTGDGPQHYKGRMRGTSHYTYGWAFNSHGEFEAEFAESFRGHVDGCGSGRMVIRSTSLTPPDFSFSGHWTIVPGFGGGDLRKARGGGTLTGRFLADGTATVKTMGTITC